jgi:hypothetical protein
VGLTRVFVLFVVEVRRRRVHLAGDSEAPQVAHKPVGGSCDREIRLARVELTPAAAGPGDRRMEIATLCSRDRLIATGAMPSHVDETASL